ncbi:hypothetical protein E2562_013346 [Oryza meyeriana var. granulata]|uniref:Uncharacterized protein n=1 Tax=Oryza meyeriana var. granulata TaxID=110450 RepID=A0A6G1CG54_9ORYZ|nr:hypothetical protein E2562_013346 [Oryza meyeriana var. granulata]
MASVLLQCSQAFELRAPTILPLSLVVLRTALPTPLHIPTASASAARERSFWKLGFPVPVADAEAAAVMVVPSLPPPPEPQVQPTRDIIVEDLAGGRLGVFLPPPPPPPLPELQLQPTRDVIVDVLEGRRLATVPPPPPPEPARNVVVAVLSRSRLAAAAADALMYLVVAGLWICLAGSAASDVAICVRGEVSRAHSVASEVSRVDILAVLLVIPVPCCCISSASSSPTPTTTTPSQRRYQESSLWLSSTKTKKRGKKSF